MKQSNEVRQETVSASDQVHIIEDLLVFFLSMFAFGEQENYIYQEVIPSHFEDERILADTPLVSN